MRNTFIVFFAILIIRGYSVPMKRQRRQIDDDIVQSNPVLDNNESISDQYIIRQSPKEKIKHEVEDSTEKLNDEKEIDDKPNDDKPNNEKPKEQITQKINKINNKCDQSTEILTTTDNPTEKLSTDTAVTKKQSKNKISKEISKTEPMKSGNQSTNVNETLSVIPLKTDKSDEELTGLFSSSENPSITERIQKMWKNLKDMMAIIEFWNKIKDFIKRWTGIDLS